MAVDWWTLGLQTVNVLVLIWLLGRFFWRPMAAMIEQRRATAQRILADAEAKHEQAKAALAEIDRTRAGFAQERDAILGEAAKAAEQARTARLQDAAKEAAALQAAAQASIDAQRAAAEKALSERASRLAVAIAQRLAARLDGPTVRNAFLEWLLKEIRTLPAPTRQAVAADSGTLEAISATPLDPPDQARYRTLIGAALDASPHIDFTVDPALIAGLELRGPHFVVANSWRADLARILTDLTRDSHA